MLIPTALTIRAKGRKFRGVNGIRDECYLVRTPCGLVAVTLAKYSMD